MRSKQKIKHLRQTKQTERDPKREPVAYLTINKKSYRKVKPQKALSIAKKLKKGIGTYKVHIVYGKQRISKRKTEVIENAGKFSTAKEARKAILAFLDKDLWK